MTKEEFSMIVKGIQEIWKGSFSTTNQMEIWYSVLKEYPYEVVNAAFQIHIREGVFEPKPANIITNINRLMPKEETMTGQEAWALVRKAISNGTYGAEEEFEKLPPVLQRCVGHPSRLREMATDMDFNEGVESSNFIRSYTELTKKQEEYDRLPSNVKAIIESNKVGLIDGSKD